MDKYRGKQNKRYNMKEKRNLKTWIVALNVTRNWISIRKCTIFNVPQRINVFLVPMCLCLYTSIRVYVSLSALECTTFHHCKVDKSMVHHNWRQTPFSIITSVPSHITVATRFVPISKWNSIVISVYRFIYRYE